MLAAAAACSTSTAPSNGTCAAQASADPACAITADGGTSATATATATLVAYACTGTARPDDHPVWAEHVPSGLVCAASGAPDASGTQGYCCTAAETDCALNPAAICDPGATGFRCRGADRPESLNPALTCGNGVRMDDFIDYCCFSTSQMDGCQQSDSVACSQRLLGWTCRGQSLPRGEELGPNKSRADYYYQLCPIPTPAANPAFNTYCCYSPALPPIGGSCVQDTAVPGCAPGRFGFACYDRDTPDQDYPVMHCPEPAIAGRSAEGYAAKLYCCDFQ